MIPSHFSNGKRFGRFILSTAVTLCSAMYFPSIATAQNFLSSTVKIGGSTPNGPALTSLDTFGRSVTSLGDLDGDGVADIAVGAARDDTGGTDRGALYLFYLNADRSVKSSVKIASGTANGPVLNDGDFYGVSVASLGDLDGDGVPEIAVGAREALHLSYLNANGSIKNTVRIDSSTANGPVIVNGDNYGDSLAALGDLDGDGVTEIAVGAIQDSSGGNYRGAVHISYLNADGSIKETVKIDSTTANGPVLANDDFYGYSVVSVGDLDGDGVPELAVGAAGDDTGGADRGAVHISYLNADGSVKNTAKITGNTLNGPVMTGGDFYGSGIASLGDLDADGVPEIAVGSYLNSTGGNGRGAVHVSFLNADGSLKRTVKIASGTANGPVLANSDWYGLSVASLGDLDGDGLPEIAAGAVLDSTSVSLGGALHISSLALVTSTVKIDDTTVNGPVLADDDFYGSSVASLGDLDGDGVADIAVGAYNDSSAGNNRGAVHISFMLADGSVKSTAKIDDSTANGPVLANSDGYGRSVASLGDLDGDGVADIVVGAYNDSSAGSNRGAVHISFLFADGSVKRTVKIDGSTANGPVLANDDSYGSSVASLGDLDGDGVADIAVGAIGDDTEGDTRGAVHISYLNADGSVKSTVKIDDSTANGPVLANNDIYGYSVASLGDLDGDGVAEIAVGAAGDSTAGSARGAVHTR